MIRSGAAGGDLCITTYCHWSPSLMILSDVLPSTGMSLEMDGANTSGRSTTGPDIMGAPPPERVAALPGKRYLLNAELSEWMMGFPPGWVTGQTDNETALRLIGNACCPPQAALAVHSLRHPTQEALFDGEGVARSTISVAGAA